MNFENMIRYRIAAIFLVCVVAFQFAGAQTQALPVEEQIVSKFDEYMSAAQRVDRFSGTVLVARDGRAIYNKGYGMANYEWEIPNTPTTVFRLGSITKQFTAAAILILQERGKLNVDDRACKYVTDCPAAWEPITIRHLLTHTSGISSYTSYPGFLEKKSVMPITPTELLAEYKQKPLDFVPGEKYSYSNSAYHLLGLIVEQASGKSYADFLHVNIFTPLGLMQTGYDSHRSLLKKRATGYVRDGEGLANSPYIDMLIPYSAGSLYSTTEDLLRWEQALCTDKLLTQKSREQMFTPFKNNYGFGWGIGKKFDHSSISHGGAIHGFSSHLSRFPDHRVTVVVLSNVQGTATEKVASSLAAIVFGAKYDIPKERKAIPISSQITDKYVGDYQLSQSITFNITTENGKLFLQIIGQPKMELFAETETDFFLKTVDAQVTFVKDVSGKVIQLIFKQGSGGGMPATKIK